MEKIWNFCVKNKIIIFILILLIAIAFPLVISSRYILRIGIVCVMYIGFALSLNLLTGMLGQMSFGHAAFWGLGAYTSAILCTKLGCDSTIAYVAAIAVCGVFGFLVGMPVLKLQGTFFTLVTLGFCEIIRLVELNWMDLTNGPIGFKGIPKPTFFGLEVKSQVGMYFVALVIALLILYVVVRITNSRLGYAVKAIRDDDISASCMGINVYKYKVMVFMISSMLCGLMGAFYSQYISYIDPSAFTTNASMEILIMVIFGGLGSIVGSVFGAASLSIIPELMRGLAEYRMLIYGLIVVILMMFRPTGLFGNINFTYIEQRLKAKRDDDIETKEISHVSTEASGESILKVENVTERFGGLVALENVNVVVNDREVVGIIGPNGAGKTTLFNVITGIYHPTEGKVFLNGEDVSNTKTHILTKHGFSRTFQNIRLCPKMTVLDNVIVGMHTKTKSNIIDAIFNTKRQRRELKECKAKAIEILKILGLYDVRYNLSTSLPYGSQRKVEIARALASDPKLLLLDEPAAGMNGQETEELMHIIRKLKELGYTILLIDHDMKFVMNACERLYVINFGKPVADGVPEEIKKNPQVIEVYLGKSS